MKPISQAVLTVVASVGISCAIGFAWVKARPAPSFVKVDIASLFDEQKAALEKNIKPGMSKEEQAKLLESATRQAALIDEALTRLVNECNCAIMNSAAIAKYPSGSDAGIPDQTNRVRAYLAQGGK